MSTQRISGASAFCAHLARLGVRTVFGVPGTQNVEICEALRRSEVRFVSATHELAAGFMANGFYRASGRVGALLTIPGPGFLYALPAIGEARLDSVAMLHIVGKASESPTPRFQLQDLDQRAIVAPLVKQVFDVEHALELGRVLQEAHETATRGEPGPVTVQISRGAMREMELPPPDRPAQPLLTPIPGDFRKYEEVFRFLQSARRVLLFVGQGMQGASEPTQHLAEWLQAPVLATTSGRGVIPEDHPLSFPLDRLNDAWDAVNELIASCDLVLALGVKFGHNGTGGFRIRIPSENLVHVDASPDVLNANFPAKHAVQGDAQEFVRWLLRRRDDTAERPLAWNLGELSGRREKMAAAPSGMIEPRFSGAEPPTAAGFFGALRRALPRNGVLATDSGLHQLLARRNFPILTQRSLLVPTDLQSMGYAIPAAMGAKLADPDRPVVALLGDGGFAMTGLEMLAAAREKIPIVVIVLNDGYFGLIRWKQVSEYGFTSGTDLQNPDFEQLAKAMHLPYFLIDGDAEGTLRRAIELGETVLVEVRVSDSLDMTKVRAKNVARETVERVLSGGLAEKLKETMKRLSGPG
ncbi:MAG: thiamine pyrophosphate-binding protein [Planctomycetes bacterium]|nr:thiamine pyrophosphate-binding protein [Planctomycetota bacterium]